MTDHANELRRYSRKIGHPAGDVPSVMLAAAEEIERLAARLEEAESDALEQARLNGMGGEREAALMAKLEAAEKSDAESLAMYRKAMDERDAMRVENEALAANLRGKHSTAGATYAHLIAERDALRAKIEQMERQAPAAEVESWTNGSYSRNYKLRWLKDVAEGDRLYALPGAQAQLAQSMPEVTDAMALAFRHALTDGSIGAREVEEIKDALRAALAAAPKLEGR